MILRGGEGLESLADRYVNYRDWALRNGASGIAFEQMRQAPLAFVRRCADVDAAIDEAVLLRKGNRWNPTRRARKLEAEDARKAELRSWIQEKEERLWDAYQELQSLP